MHERKCFDIKLKVYGCKGSVPHHKPTSETSCYGGNTTCLTLESEGDVLILDAGTGILSLEKELKSKYPNYPVGIPAPVIVLSHLHLDHIAGFSTFAPVWHDEAKMSIYSFSHDERPIKEQIFGVFKPPYWPVMTTGINVDCIPIEKGTMFNVGCFNLHPFEAAHPDNSYNFHITDGKHTVAYLVDCEVAALDPAAYQKLIDICKDVDVIVLDASYSPEDYETKKGWGHSTYEDGVKLAHEANCKRILFTHYSPEYSNAEIDRWRHDLESRYPGNDKFLFAKEGMELIL